MSVPVPYWTDGQVDLHHGDCLDILPLLPAESVDAVITDPPYGLTELSTAKVLQAIAAWMAGDRTHVPSGAGFMGREWDKFVPPPGVWDECLRVLKPGGHLLVFAGPRTMDLMGLSIRIAGFELRDAVADLTGVDGPGLLWVYAQGMAKSRDVAKDLDRIAGRIGSSIDAVKRSLRERFTESGLTMKAIDEACGFRASNYLTVAGDHKRPDPWVNVLPSAEKWAVIRRVLNCGPELDELFTAAQREVIGRKRVGAGVAFTSIGPTEIDVTAPATDEARQWNGWGTALRPSWEPVIVARKPLKGIVAANVQRYGTGAINIDACRVHPLGSPGAATADGRWPANLVLAHSPTCVHVGERVIKGDSRAGQKRGTCQGGFMDVGAPSGDVKPNGPLRGDQVVPVFECSPGCPAAEMDRQSGDRAAGSPVRGTEPSQRMGANGIYGYAGSDRPQFAGYRDQGGASRFFPVFRYEPKAPPAERPRLEDGRSHETVKPLGLIRWLAKLVTCPGGLILDLFAGTGPVGEAAIIEGFRAILIDKDLKSVELARTRLSKDIQPDLFGGGGDAA